LLHDVIGHVRDWACPIFFFEKEPPDQHFCDDHHSDDGRDRD